MDDEVVRAAAQDILLDFQSLRNVRRRLQDGYSVSGWGPHEWEARIEERLIALAYVNLPVADTSLGHRE